MDFWVEIGIYTLVWLIATLVFVTTRSGLYETKTVRGYERKVLKERPLGGLRLRAHETRKKLYVGSIVFLIGRTVWLVATHPAEFELFMFVFAAVLCVAAAGVVIYLSLHLSRPAWQYLQKQLETHVGRSWMRQNWRDQHHNETGISGF